MYPYICVCVCMNACLCAYTPAHVHLFGHVCACVSYDDMMSDLELGDCAETAVRFFKTNTVYPPQQASSLTMDQVPLYHVHVSMYVWKDVCMYACMYVCMLHVCMYVCMYVCMCD